MNRFARTLVLAAALALGAVPCAAAEAPAPSPTPATSPSPTPTPIPTTYRANLLTMDRSLLTFTGGETVRLAPGCACASLPTGAEIVIHVDLARDLVTSVRAASDADANLPSAAIIPRSMLAMDPRSIRPDRAAAERQAHLVEVRITVTVPPQTPQTDDIYLSTSRTMFNPAEIRMNRVDALHWTVTLALPAGAALHYEFTRGSYQTVERDLSNGTIPARNMVARAGETQTSVVAKWADQ